jgi:ankyrin repeat protein
MFSNSTIKEPWKECAKSYTLHEISNSNEIANDCRESPGFNKKFVPKKFNYNTSKETDSDEYKRSVQSYDYLRYSDDIQMVIGTPGSDYTRRDDVLHKYRLIEYLQKQNIEYLKKQKIEHYKSYTWVDCILDAYNEEIEIDTFVKQISKIPDFKDFYFLSLHFHGYLNADYNMDFIDGLEKEREKQKPRDKETSPIPIQQKPNSFFNNTGGGKKKTRKKRKSKRKSRSKKQKGGDKDQEEKNYDLFKAINMYGRVDNFIVDINKVEEALDNGADINAPDQVNGLTPLMYAALTENIKLLKMLLSKGADVNAVTDVPPYLDGLTGHGATALMYASMQKNTEAVYQLLENGADINMKTDTGKTALMYANSYGQMEVVYILLRAYAFQSGDTVNEENFNTNCIDIDKEITYDDIIEGETTINIRKYLQDNKDNIVLVYKSNKKDVDLEYFITTRTIITNVYNDKVNKFFGCDNEQGKFGESSYFNNITFLKLNKTGLIGTYEYCDITPLLENEEHQLFAIKSLNIKFPSFVSHNVLYNSDVEEAMVSGSHCQGGDAAHVSTLIKVKPCRKGVKRKLEVGGDIKKGKKRKSKTSKKTSKKRTIKRKRR